ncbi:MAG: hypothetical protein LBE12_19510 [Planctomycetaceae bacterium]|jgi:hypothetical protein|nr:hypothetical protein [Planctomycetaceae bacterium]
MKSNHLFLLLTIFVALLFSSCKQGNPYGFEEITGKITYNGQPTSLMLAFDPLDSNNSQSGGSALTKKDGTFLMTGQSGLKHGKYRVRFILRKSYWKKTMKPVEETETDVDRTQRVLVNVLPEEFTTEKSKVEFNVTSEKKNIFNYDIISDYKPSENDIKSKKVQHY